MERLLLIATCLLNTLTFASGWDAECTRDGYFCITPEAQETYEANHLQWNLYVATKEDWIIDDGIAFEIAMPSLEGCACAERNKEFCHCETKAMGEYDTSAKTGEPTMEWFFIYMEKLVSGAEQPAIGCELSVEFQKKWNLGFDALVRNYKGYENVKVIQSKRLNGPHFVGYVEYEFEQYLCVIADEIPAIERVYLDKEGILYTLSTTLKHPTLRKHFFESFKLLD